MSLAVIGGGVLWGFFFKDFFVSLRFSQESSKRMALLFSVRFYSVPLNSIRL